MIDTHVFTGISDIRSVPSMEDLPEAQEVINSLLENTPAAPDHTLMSENAVETVIEILEDEPSPTIEYGPDIRTHLASSFEYIATQGLDPALRNEISGKYKIPSNCSLIAAPILNAEMKAALPEPILKRDKSFEIVQRQIASAISCLASAVTDQLSSEQTNKDLLKKLMDTGRLLCDLQSTYSKSRRDFAMLSVDKDMKEHLSRTKVDNYLFGENLSESDLIAKAYINFGTDVNVQHKILEEAVLPLSSESPPEKAGVSSLPISAVNKRPYRECRRRR